MKTAIETYIPVKRFGVEQGLRLIAESGFRGIDFTYYFELESLLETDDYLEDALKTRAQLDELSLTCRQAHAPFCLRWQDDLRMDHPHFRNTVRSMQTASVLGAEIIIVHAMDLPAGHSAEALHETNLRMYRALEPYCKQYQIKIGVENLGKSLSCPETMNRMMEQLDPEWFGICLDVGHVKMLGKEPEDYLSELLPNRLLALHIHDNDGTDDQHQLPYLGKISWDAVLANLNESGYDGDLTMEAWRFLDCVPQELTLDAMLFEHTVAEHLASCFDVCKMKQRG